MTEVEIVLVPIKIDYLCDKCKKGFYRPLDTMDNLQFSLKVKTHRHKCMECGDGQFFDVRYPYIKYIPREEIND